MTLSTTTPNWNLKITDPSGETRWVELSAALGPVRAGRDPDCEVVLRDPTAPPVALQIWPSPDAQGAADASPYWVRSLAAGAPPPRLGGLAVREAQLAPGVRLRVAESELELVAERRGRSLPDWPRGVKPWFTASERGAELLWLVRKAAATPLSVYLGGETGVGKEVLAHLVHAWSERASGPFVPLNCASLPLSLAESELFGHVKGAFTGAHHHRAGALMQAHNGTLFLDEVGDLPPELQVKLLRFLEDGEIRPVGADRASRADVRLVCATHKPLEELVETGRFRRDLYFRIASITVRIPPLRDRPEDIELLARRFASDLSRGLAPSALLRLQAYDWPGNVRELRHAVERAGGLSGAFKATMDEEDFAFLGQATAAARRDADRSDPANGCLRLDEMERRMLLKALRLSGGNRAGAARILGVARSTLFEMLKRHDIQGPRRSDHLRLPGDDADELAG